VRGVEELGVAFGGGGGEVELGDPGAVPGRLADRLRALGEEQPLPGPERTSGEPPRGHHLADGGR